MMGYNAYKELIKKACKNHAIKAPKILEALS